MSRGPDAGTLLQRALERASREAGCSIAIVDTRLEQWASATFVGARHRLTLHARDEAKLELWLAGLPDADLPMRGHLVADLVVATVTCNGGRAVIAIEALTVEA